MVVTFVKGQGRAAVDLYDFLHHIDGTDFRQRAHTIDTNVPLLNLGNATTVQQALDWLNAHPGGGGGPGVVNLSDLSATTGILPIVRGGTGLGTIGVFGTVFTSDGTNGIWQTIVNSNISSSAAIAVSKLAPSGTNNFVLTTVGGVPTWAAPTGTGSSVNLYGPTISGSVNGSGVLTSLDVDGYAAATVLINSATNIRGIASGAALSSRRLILKFASSGSTMPDFSTTTDLSNADRINTTARTFNSGDSIILYWGALAGGNACWSIVTAGEATTASNSGLGLGLVQTKVGVNIPFKSLTAGSNIVLTSNANDIGIATTAEVNTTSNSGSGAGLAQAKVGANLPFKSIVAGTNISITQNTNDITISAAGSVGEANTTSNSGSGIGLAQAKSGVNLPFKSIIAGTNISIANNANDITISSSGGTGDITLGQTVGAGPYGWYYGKSGTTLQFKSFQAYSPIFIGNNPDQIIFSIGGLTSLGSAGQAMRVSSGGGGLEWFTPSSGGTPAGTTGEVQINNAGVFGAPGNIFMGSGYMQMGATGSVPSVGKIRFGTGSGAILIQRNSANTANQGLIAADNSRLFIGCDDATGSPIPNIWIYPSTTISFGLNGIEHHQMNSNNWLFGKPVLGMSGGGPYGIHGQATINVSTTGPNTVNLVGSAAISRQILYFTFSGSYSGSSTTVILPGASTDDQSYEKTIRKVSSFNSNLIFQSNLGGTTYNMNGPSGRAFISVTPQGVNGVGFIFNGGSYAGTNGTM